MNTARPTDLGTLRVLAIMRIMWCYNFLALDSYAWHIREATTYLEMLPAAAWHPASMARWFDAPPSAGFAHFLSVVGVSSVALLMLGVWTRGMSVLCLVTNTLLLCLAMSWGKIGHNTQIMLLLLFVLSFSDWGHCWSIDSVVQRLRRRRHRGHLTAHATWPIWVSTFVLAFLYVNSGMHKLLKGQFLGEGFYQYLKWRMVYWEQVRGEVPAWVLDVVTWGLQYPALIWVCSLGALLFEAGFFVALMSTRLRLLMLCGVFVFHGMIGVLAGMFFLSPMIAAAIILVPTVILMLRERVAFVARVFPASDEPIPAAERMKVPVWARVAIGIFAIALGLLMAAPTIPADLSAAWPAAVTEAIVASSWFLFIDHQQFVVIAAVMLVPCAAVAGWMLVSFLRVLAGRSAPCEHVLLYDGDCGFCQRWCNWARARGAEPAVRFETCQSATAVRDKADISDAQCIESAFLVEIRDGQVIDAKPAAGAINGVLAILPGAGNAHLRCFSMLYGLQGFRQIEDVGYRLVARWRSRLGGGACGVGETPKSRKAEKPTPAGGRAAKSEGIHRGAAEDAEGQA